MSVILSLSFFFFLESPMPLVSSGRPSATCASSVLVDSMQILFSRDAGWCQAPRRLGVLKFWASGSDVAVSVELETPFLS